MCYSLGRVVYPSATPESLFEEGVTPTFGVVREHALKFALACPAKTNFWGASVFASVLKNEAAARALEELNKERNNFAHGRTNLPLADIEQLVATGLQLLAWTRIGETDGELKLADWSPWVATSLETISKAGLFERWQKKSIRYLVPETGEIFKFPRKVVASL
jgi:hypothetical protein